MKYIITKNIDLETIEFESQEVEEIPQMKGILEALNKISPIITREEVNNFDRYERQSYSDDE